MSIYLDHVGKVSSILDQRGDTSVPEHSNQRLDRNSLQMKSCLLSLRREEIRFIKCKIYPSNFMKNKKSELGVGLTNFIFLIHKFKSSNGIF